MNVLMIEHFSPGNAYSEELTNRLINYENVSVACKNNANFFGENVYQFRILYGGGENKLSAALKYIAGLLRLKKEIKSGKYQIIHVQTFKNAAIEMKLYIRACAGTKLVHTVHNLLPHEVGEHDKHLYTEFYKKCDALIVHNEECKRQLINVFQIQDEKIYVVPHGAYSVKAETENKKNNKLHVLMFGMIRHYKGVDILLEAISKIPAKEQSNMEFLIAGKQYANQDPKNYHAMIHELKISECTRLINERIDDKELPKLFGWADVCVFPYREIYGSGALLMAYAYGKPVIASDVPVFVEETDHGRTGMLFQSENPVELAKTLQKYANLANKDINGFKENIAELVKNKYNWDISAQRTSAVYRKLVNGDMEVRKINE